MHRFDALKKWRALQDKVDEVDRQLVQLLANPKFDLDEHGEQFKQVLFALHKRRASMVKVERMLLDIGHLPTSQARYHTHT